MEENEIDAHAQAPETPEETSVPEVEQEATPEVKTDITDEDIEKTPDLTKEFDEKELNEVDEKGSTLRERLAEERRKLAQAEKEKQDILLQQQLAQEEKPAYSIEDLTAFYNSTEDQASRQWAYDQIKAIEKQNTIDLVRKEYEKLEANKNYQLAQRDALIKCQTEFPEAFERDNRGNFTGRWNENSILFQKARALYNSDPGISSHPFGLYGAMAITASTLLKDHVNYRARENQQLKNKYARLQTKVMTEGGGNASNYVPGNAGLQNAMAKLKATGSMKDASSAMGEILRKGGMISD